jgi:hypothetical protein
LDVDVNDVDVYHSGNDTQSMEVGKDIYGIHSFEGGIENMEFGRDVGGIDESRGDAVGTQIHRGIGGSQLIAGIINIFTFHVVEDEKATQRKLASIVVVPIPRASPLVSESL